MASTASSRSDGSGGSGSPQSRSTATLAVGCINPIRLRGFYQRIAADTGEVLALLGSQEGGAAILLVCCKDRRASCCPYCSRLYERDAYHLLAAGLRGAMSVPETVTRHPAVMLTLTAPSFGAVHGNRDNERPCSCGRRHDRDDPQLGRAIDPRSYRYIDQVVWNRHAPELWKRTVQAIRRGLAQELCVPRSKLSQTARVRFAKVAEFQRRGVVHYHALIRIDGPDGIGSPPPSQCTAGLLAEVAERAAEVVSVPLLKDLASAARTAVRWGSQRDVVALDPNTCTAAAGYIAKYATKATEMATGGTLVKPIRAAGGLARLALAEHPRELVTAAWRIGERSGDEGFKRWAHQFGYGGHTLTKSHQYSVTFAALRAARASWRSASEGEVIVRANLSYAGRGPLLARGPK